MKRIIEDVLIQVLVEILPDALRWIGGWLSAVPWG